ncbi:MAG: hypothetical protein Ct9H300mP1_25380 [Planctomycetaceae bacterium]|nr:MAG: hypothetical protein Ct9H300mP1_25380 [Planctomycetaceae bacterium]
MRLSCGGESTHDLVFLAMTHFQLNSKTKAADLLKKVKASPQRQSKRTRNWTPSLKKPKR